MSAIDVVETLTVAWAASLAASILIVLTQRWHGSLSLDKDTDGIQKFHLTPTPRVGGIALMIGMLAAFMYQAFVSMSMTKDDIDRVLALFISAMPAFLAGGIEDITKKVSVKTRLFATFASALLACWLLGASLPRLDLWGIDPLLQVLPLAAIAFTAFAVAGVANSINIIDGFHGVAGSAVVIMLTGMAILASRMDDMLVTSVAVLGIGATMGFLFINYPTGRLFMGDGGAYFLGFWLAETAVLLIARNPTISAWQVLAICSYPVIEVLYSIYRKKFVRKMSPGEPDRLHLHMLIYRRLVWRMLPRNDAQPWIRNAAVTCFIATWIAVLTAISLIAGHTTSAAMFVVALNTMLYVSVYGRLVRGYWRLKRVSPLGAARVRTQVRNIR